METVSETIGEGAWKAVGGGKVMALRAQAYSGSTAAGQLRFAHPP